MTTATVDLRPLLAPVRDQGRRGTCLAFAVTALHEVCRTSGVPGDEDLAEEALYWGCKQVDGNWSSGTSFESASIALPRWGQPIESLWPYNPRHSDGASYRPPVTPGGDDWFQAELHRVETTSASVRALLVGNVPVALGITLYSSFYRPEVGGRVSTPQPGDGTCGRHAVVAVGFDAESVLVRNSWGPTWGVGGYGWITNAYIDDHATDVWTLNFSSTRTTTDYSTSSYEIEGTTYGDA